MGLFISLMSGWLQAAEQQKPNPSSASETRDEVPRVFGESYAALRPEQKKLVDEFVHSYNETTGNTATPAQTYDGARISVRTTFDAVTHALLKTQITNEEGRNLGTAIDLIEGLDDVAGEEDGVGGDRQFRMYVYLKPTAFEMLSNSREFQRGRDNTVYHKGFPICFRLKKGPPSIQVSISRDQHMADIDVDYRSSSFPKALFNGHLTAANSDVRAGGNLDTHDHRWEGLNGWWREIFGFSLGRNAAPKEEETGRGRTIPLNPAMKAGDGVDAAAHDFLKSWVVDKQPRLSVAYLSRRSYPCLEQMAARNQKPIPNGMVQVRTAMAMDKFNASTGEVKSVGDIFEAEQDWVPQLKAEENTFPTEFRLVKVPPDMARDEECVPASDDGTGKTSKEKFYATVFRARQGDSPNKVMLLLWAKEGKYWKIVALRVEDRGTTGLGSKKISQIASAPAEPETITGDSTALKDIASFYEDWLIKRDAASAARYASKRSYACVNSPSSPLEKNMTPLERIRYGLNTALIRVPKEPNLSDMMSPVQPVNEFVHPVEQEHSKAFAVMAVPNPMGDSFLCQQGSVSKKIPALNPSDVKYGAYYLSASRLNFGEEESPALLLLWRKENTQWKVAAWAVEVP